MYKSTETEVQLHVSWVFMLQSWKFNGCVNRNKFSRMSFYPLTLITFNMIGCWSSSTEAFLLLGYSCWTKQSGIPAAKVSPCLISWNMNYSYHFRMNEGQLIKEVLFLPEYLGKLFETRCLNYQNNTGMPNWAPPADDCTVQAWF